MFLAGLFIAVPYSVGYLAFAVTGKAYRKLPIVMNSSRHLHSSSGYFH